ncbi:MAG: valine--tRNA ligase, partial [Hyphomicrobiaceae bacterium]|nr:valine--tRNA ligase [Hyphomicrobiaceae bacterium]
MLDKTYDAAQIEPRIAARWDEAQAFKAGAGKVEGEAPFCIVIPPPNVTGSLHMGHALNNTLQDILVRLMRMRGRDVLWQPGLDHAGIATQMVVERQMMERQEPGRRDIGREKFLEKVWSWKAESGGTIVNQLKRLGASCDWSRERFTMDEGLSKAVVKVFVELYKQGLIYKDKRLVNWDTVFETAISDLEVENREVNGQMWHFKYPLAGGETYEYIERDADGNITLQETRDYISIATTRPETMLGDGAVAVHPADERYAPIVGKLCEIPVGPKEHRRLIPIITDEYPDRHFGSGAVKITGAHDANDYGVARRCGIPMYRLMDTRGAMRADGAPYAEEAEKARAIVASGVAPDPVAVDAINLVPDVYRGLDRFAARARVVADIDAEGLMIRIENKKIQQPFGDRSNTVIEPMLTDQWFANAEELAKPAIAAVREGRTAFVPKQWENTYYQWMENIQPWCVSRQLWWGHQIPAWYGPDGTVFVEASEAEAQAAADAHYGAPTALKRDEDVLDTWFSSALWPFSTLGWPDKTPELARYYQTDVLVTGFDIIFFWVARMIMLSTHLTGQIPFKTVYVHGLVRDGQGQKMSKSKGNVLDPLDIVDGITLDELLTKRTSGMMQPKLAEKIAKQTRAEFPEGIASYGTDALRFTFCSLASTGRDIKFDMGRVEGYRNFCNKIWNAANFVFENTEGKDTGVNGEPVELSSVDRWIISALQRTEAEVTRQLEAFRFDLAAQALYEFIWDEYCAWYLELVKPLLWDETASVERQRGTRRTLVRVLETALRLAHPFMPFITEEIWQRVAPLAGKSGPTLMLQPWPEFNPERIDEAAEGDIEWVKAFMLGIRQIRGEMNISMAKRI